MIEYVDETHTYLYDGVIIPSVSEILRFIFPNKYSLVPKEVLNKKATYGSTVHEAIEKLEQGKELPKLDYIQQASITQYLKLKEKYNIEVHKQEQIINYEDKYAGRFDMIADINGVEALCDIKTTAELDKEYLSWQLSLYAYAYKNMYDEDFEKLYAIWLPKKELGKVIEIERKTDEEIEDVLKEYYSSRITEEDEYYSYIDGLVDDHRLGLI